jgi:class 3 adenylate cyclase
METHPTIVFMDLSGSSAAYEALDNARVAAVVSKTTRWIGQVCQAHGGRVIKYLGDGVLARFPTGIQSVSAAVFVQQGHTAQVRQQPRALRMGLKIGLASGPVVEMDADAYGDSVNLAARLADMAGGGQIWADESVLSQVYGCAPSDIPTPTEEGVTLISESAVRSRALGKIHVPGLTQARSVFQIFWNDDIPSELLTAPGRLDTALVSRDGSNSRIALAWLDVNKTFTAGGQTIRIGRAAGSDFLITDRRVSRQHVKIEWTQGTFVLTDVSSFGTWVRFAETPESEIALRRTQCLLHSTGEIALGAPFSDFSVPVLSFHVLGVPVVSEQRKLPLRGSAP